MNETTKTEVETRVSKGGNKSPTVFSVDWNGMERDDLIALAVQTLVIKRQTQWRKNGIPAVENVKAIDYKVGTRQPRQPREPVSIEALLTKLSQEERNELLAKYYV